MPRERRTWKIRHDFNIVINRCMLKRVGLTVDRRTTVARARVCMCVCIAYYFNVPQHPARSEDNGSREIFRSVFRVRLTRGLRVVITTYYRVNRYRARVANAAPCSRIRWNRRKIPNCSTLFRLILFFSSTFPPPPRFFPPTTRQKCRCPGRVTTFEIRIAWWLADGLCT
jgi:hypothetical protein